MLTSVNLSKIMICVIKIKNFLLTKKCDLSTINSPNEDHVKNMLQTDDVNWSLHYAKYQDVLNEIKLEDISFQKACAYTNSKAFSKMSSNLSSISCLNEDSIGKSTVVTQKFAIRTEKLFKGLKSDVFVENNFQGFYCTDVYTPATNPNSKELILSLYKGFDQLPYEDVSQKICTIVTQLSKKLVDFVDPCLIKQIDDLSSVNEILVGLALLPHLLLYMGYIPFWSLIFPFFLKLQGNVQFFTGLLKATFFSVKIKIPLYFSTLAGIVEYKWSLLGGTALVAALMQLPIIKFIQPMVNSVVYKIFFKELPWYQKFVQGVKYKLR